MLQDSDKNLKKIEDELRTAERSQAKVNAKVESINEEISNEIEKKKQLEKVLFLSPQRLSSIGYHFFLFPGSYLNFSFIEPLEAKSFEDA